MSGTAGKREPLLWRRAAPRVSVRRPDRRSTVKRMSPNVVLDRPKCGCWMLAISRLNVVHMLTC